MTVYLATVKRQMTNESSKIAERRHPDNPDEKEMISKLDIPDEAFTPSQNGGNHPQFYARGR